MRKSIRDILYDHRKDPSNFPLRSLLRILSYLYGAGVFIRNTLYDWKILKTLTIPAKVISIGNITAGGTGKTPVTIMTARLLIQAGYSLSVVSRGYRRKGNGILVVSDKSGINAKAVQAGDEPHIIASSLHGVPVVVGKNRSAAATRAFERFNPDIILLDDAFQHRRLNRDADIVTIDAENPFDTGYLLPRGALRESPRALARAHAVIITRCDDERNFLDVKKKIFEYSPGIPIFTSRHIPRSFRRPGNGKELDLSSIAGKKIAALSNIANPDSFHRMLESLGAEIVLKRSMDDHHKYNLDEFENIRKDVLLSEAELMVMTAKDERNLPEDYCPSVLLCEYVLDIETVLDGDEKKYVSLITGQLKKPKV
jgi:tetraacyldisaccharide 4'-kinase